MNAIRSLQKSERERQRLVDEFLATIQPLIRFKAQLTVFARPVYLKTIDGLKCIDRGLPKPIEKIEEDIDALIDTIKSVYATKLSE